jgi:flagellin
MTVINTNVKSVIAANALKVNGRAMANAMEQLSTGKRINSASDDAAGLAISESMTAQSRGLNTAVRNANDGISMAQTAEGALIEVSNMLQRMRELAVQAATGTISDTQRGYLKNEATALADQIDSTIANTRWNNIQVLSEANMTSGMQLQVGDSGAAINTATEFKTVKGSADVVFTTNGDHGLVVGDTVRLSQGSDTDGITLNGLFTVTATSATNKFTVVASTTGTNGIATTAAANLNGWQKANSVIAVKGASLAGVAKNVILATNASDMSNAARSSAAIAKIDTGLEAVNTARANLGAAVNRLTSIVDNLSNVSQNLIESRSRILDTDYAAATTELARTQIIQQAGMAVLAQANQQPQSVLSLLRS